MSESQQELQYKGRPLVRCGDTVFYGDMADPFVVKMEIKSKKQVAGTDVAEKITVQLLTTDPSVRPKRQILKSSDREGFYNALDVGCFWLERALEGK